MATSPAFMLIEGTQIIDPGDPDPGTDPDDGYFGTSAFGTTSFGMAITVNKSGDFTLKSAPVTVPSLAPGSDRLDRKHRPVAAEKVHSRDGVIVGARLFTTRYRWRCVWRALTEAEMSSLRTFFLARKFYLLPYGTEELGAWVVRWTNSDFSPETIRGGYYNLQADLEEVPL